METYTTCRAIPNYVPEPFKQIEYKYFSMYTYMNYLSPFSFDPSLPPSLSLPTTLPPTLPVRSIPVLICMSVVIACSITLMKVIIAEVKITYLSPN